MKKKVNAEISEATYERLKSYAHSRGMRVEDAVARFVLLGLVEAGS